MKQKVYFYASLNDHLKNISKNSLVYDDITKCIVLKAYDILSSNGIKPTYGILTDEETEIKEYTLIERYNKQFKNLNCSLCVYCIPQHKTKLCNNKVSDEVAVAAIKKIENLYVYLENAKNIALIKNDSPNKSWYNVPSTNYDIIKEYFLNKINSENKMKDIPLEKLFPKQEKLIQQLKKLRKLMSKEEFILYLDMIYNEHHDTINYSALDEKLDYYSTKSRIKRFFKKVY